MADRQTLRCILAIGPDLEAMMTESLGRICYPSRVEEIKPKRQPPARWLSPYEHTDDLNWGMLGLQISFGSHPLRTGL